METKRPSCPDDNVRWIEESRKRMVEAMELSIDIRRHNEMPSRFRFGPCYDGHGYSNSGVKS